MSFEPTTDLYDAFYSWKDYAVESEKILAMVGEHGAGRTGSLLDVACGTGEHLRHLVGAFDRVVGIDLLEKFVEIARTKVPTAEIMQGDMRSFDLNETFDLVTCLFSSIGYLTTPDDRRRAITTMASHVADGGLLIVEPWVLPEEWTDNRVHMITIDDEKKKGVRIGNAIRDGRITTLTFEYLVGTPTSMNRYSEEHVAMMSTREELLEDVQAARLEGWWDEEGIMGRGAVIGRR